MLAIENVHGMFDSMSAVADKAGIAAASVRDKRLRDPVHGLITFQANAALDQLAWQLIDTPEFQRLRRIKQLGVSEYVFPGATHTRFAHSIGVFHTARQLIEIIRRELRRKRQDEDFDLPRAEVAVTAALLHDLGHGPFSHTFEGVQKERGIRKSHERWSAEIIRNPNGCIAPLLAGFRQEGGFGEQVALLLENEDPVDIYHAVVSSSFDADRLDYLRRDRLMTGTHAGAIDFDWLLEHVRVHPVSVEAADPDDDGATSVVPTFCLDLKALPAAEQFLLARYTLHEQVYLHKTTRCAEYMISKLLGRVAQLAEEAPDAAGQAGLNAQHPIWRFFKSKEPSLQDYLDLDDGIVMAACEPMSRAADRTVADLAGRLRERRFYKTLDLRSFGGDEGHQGLRARRIDSALKRGDFQGEVFKDEGAKIGIYTQIGGDDERMHKKLHIVDAQGAREISTPLINARPHKEQFTRYYFENESDRESAKTIRRSG